MGPRNELDRFRVNLPETHFWSGQIGHDRNPLSSRIGRVTDSLDHFGVIGKVAVGKIQAGNADPGVDQASQHLRRFGSRANGGDNLGLMRAQGRTHELNMVWPFPRRSVTACFTRSAMLVSPRAR